MCLYRHEIGRVVQKLEHFRFFSIFKKWQKGGDFGAMFFMFIHLMSEPFYRSFFVVLSFTLFILLKMSTLDFMAHSCSGSEVETTLFYIYLLVRFWPLCLGTMTLCEQVNT